MLEAGRKRKGVSILHPDNFDKNHSPAVIIGTRNKTVEWAYSKEIRGADDGDELNNWKLCVYTKFIQSLDVVITNKVQKVGRSVITSEDPFL